MRPRLLAAALLVGLVACSTPAGSTAHADLESLNVNVMDFMLEPEALEVTGPRVAIEVTNDGPTPHNLTIRDATDEVVAATADLSSGQTETINVDLEPGEYTVFCSLAGHESLGMSGSLTVSGP